MRPGISRVVFEEHSILVIEELEGAQYVAKWYRSWTDGVISPLTKPLGPYWLCEILSDHFLVKAKVGGDVVIEALHAVKNFALPISEVDRCSALATQRPGKNKTNAHRIACGEEDGHVGVWEVRFDGVQPTLRKLFRSRVHEGAVTALAFLEDYTLLSGGRDKMIYRLDLYDAGSISNRYVLRLDCMGMKVDGLQSERENRLLRHLLEKARAATRSRKRSGSK